ncbi:hypothetical protein PPERSA_02590 [Pseudocohnilembus persalinus]|uniref:Uncharacterized protein n=1 Tax=Pseudocohnilembus persalinus TaxID=266149 RepID=A0A0V0R5E5_PSEPJ|nr:hypothetical protein PPERSA_02590 [Pseudocohnilembus persalinus]|eukprot:KRX09718.1 hypothetical protein PPERSA_02590 [Pseudocohnilembus persalinus]
MAHENITTENQQSRIILWSQNQNDTYISNTQQQQQQQQTTQIQIDDIFTGYNFLQGVKLEPVSNIDKINIDLKQEQIVIDNQQYLKKVYEKIFKNQIDKKLNDTDFHLDYYFYTNLQLQDIIQSQSSYDQTQSQEISENMY